jgi:hypothetical protein
VCQKLNRRTQGATMAGMPWGDDVHGCGAHGGLRVSGSRVGGRGAGLHCPHRRALARRVP